MDLGKTIPDEQQQALLFDCVGSFQLESPNQTKERNHNNGAIEMRKEVSPLGLKFAKWPKLIRIHFETLSNVGDRKKTLHKSKTFSLNGTS